MRGDPDPNGIIGNLLAALRHGARVAQPAIRRGWLERGPGPDDRRGRDEFVSVSWDRALDLLGGELTRIRDAHGPGAVFGGSYGWSSAGRFHHAQSQVHRFLNIAMGGYVRSVNTYSSGASSVLLPQILGGYEDITKRNVTWEQIAGETEIVLAFGGMALKNSMVASGSISKHVERRAMAAARRRGCEFILVSPQPGIVQLPTGAWTIRWIPRKRLRSAFTAIRMCPRATLAPHPSPRDALVSSPLSRWSASAAICRRTALSIRCSGRGGASLRVE
jgi:biotin/methionine sulfoxide reductase